MALPASETMLDGEPVRHIAQFQERQRMARIERAGRDALAQHAARR